MHRKWNGMNLSLGATVAIGLGLVLAWTSAARAAGTVKVLVSEEELIIEGDGQPNCIRINGGGSPGEYSVHACDGSTVVKCKVRQTECSGENPVNVTEVDDDIKVAMFEGDDEVDVDDGDNDTAPDDLEINTGGGNDKVTLHRFAVLDDLEIVTGSGNDLVMLDEIAVHDSTRIQTGSGTDCTVYGLLTPASATECPTAP